MTPYQFYLPIAGTHGWRGAAKGRWWAQDSAFAQYLRGQGFEHLGGDRPFVWTTDVNGHRPWRRWLGAGNPHLDWDCGGENLRNYLRPYRDATDNYTPIGDRRLIAHSHGLQVVLYACAKYDLKIHRLVSVMSPVRDDMMALAEEARPNIGSWMHLYTDSSDGWQVLGQLGDGKLFGTRRHPMADYSIRVRGVGHTGVLENPSLFSLWRAAGWLGFLSEPHHAVKTA